MECNLPKLLYVGDVPVESTVAGSALLYRLLQEYPTNQLKIVEGNIAVSQPQYRLSNVSYLVLSVGSQRLLHSRLTPLYNAFLLLTSKQISQLGKLIPSDFQPEAILTVAHGFSWICAAKLAQQLSIPLHLIVHDDPIATTPVPVWYLAKLVRQFKTVYRQGRSRICVSPYMEAAYRKRYGVTGNILYPSRAKDTPKFTTLAPRQNSKQVKFAYAGSLHSPGQIKTLIDLASILDKLQGKLIIYAALTLSSAKNVGLDRANIELRSLIPSRDLITTLRTEADVLFAPMDFDEQHKTHMQLCFPSKLADYTAVGLPLLIWGAAYCSAVRWARDNLGVAEVVDTQDLASLSQAVIRLIESSEYRDCLAQQALVKGAQYFSYETAKARFYRAIASNR